MMNTNLQYEKSEGIGKITFYHPQSNSLPGTLLRELAALIIEAGADESVRVIILQSAGDKAFCAGASFDELIAIDSFEKGKYFFSGFADVINAIRLVPKFVLGRVQGKAVGGGVGIAAAVDYCLATENASVKLSELAVGIGPFVVGPAVERKMGLSAFQTLAIHATEWKDAHWASKNGLFAKVCADIPALDLEVDKLAKILADSNPEAMHELKKIAWNAYAHWDTLLYERAEISGRLVLSDFTRNAINSFKAK